MGLVPFAVLAGVAGLPAGVKLDAILVHVLPLAAAWIIGLRAIGGDVGASVRADAA